LAETIALVGSETLLGREVREVFGETALGQSLRLVGEKGGENVTLTEIGGAASFIAKMEADALEDAAVVVLAGSAESSRSALAAKPSGVVIDLTGAAEDDPEARVRAPQAEQGARRRGGEGPQIVAHPAAIAIAIVLKRIHESWPVGRAVVQIFGPASEHGSKGVEELQEQTVKLLSFQAIPKGIFDAQLSYAMLPQLGRDAPVQLDEIEDRIERHLASLLETMDGVPMPSFRLIQAPVFHGYSFSFWVELEETPPASEIEEAMDREPIEIRKEDVEPPNNVGVAGQGGVTVGAIVPDRNNANAFWIWAVADNLRLMAENAAMIAAEAI
jgi:aspartate-semialdehyde dehydrogenase